MERGPGEIWAFAETLNNSKSRKTGSRDCSAGDLELSGEMHLTSDLSESNDFSVKKRLAALRLGS